MLRKLKVDTYIPEVDGLRAFAVLSVIFFHLSTPFVTGGYIGVDIFFVISGYLITSLIVRDIKVGAFSFADFYARRFRRIFPALIVTLLVSALVFGFYSSPSSVELFGTSSIAAILSVSNIFFWWTSSYFDPSSATNPLLHTWSLSVEEQFYLFWPIALVVMHRFKSFAIGISAIVIFGLVASQLAVSFDASGAFYISPFRFFEFAIGALLVCIPK